MRRLAIAVIAKLLVRRVAVGSIIEGLRARSCTFLTVDRLLAS